MAQRKLQADVVSAEHALVNALKGVEQAAVFFPVPGAQEAAAKHGGQGKRNKTGNQNGRADGDRKLVQQPSEDAAQKKHWDEYRRQRERHGDDGEANFLRTTERGLKHPLAHLHVPDDVLQHDDGVVHDEADRKRQGHQREVVQRIAEQIHHRERAHNRHWQRQAGDHRRGKISQEEEDHHHHQGDGQEKGELDVPH